MWSSARGSPPDRRTEVRLFKKNVSPADSDELRALGEAAVQQLNTTAYLRPVVAAILQHAQAVGRQRNHDEISQAMKTVVAVYNRFRSEVQSPGQPGPEFEMHYTDLARLSAMRFELAESCGRLNELTELDEYAVGELRRDIMYAHWFKMLSDTELKWAFTFASEDELESLANVGYVNPHKTPG